MTNSQEEIPLPTERDRGGVIDVDPNEEVVSLHYSITSYGADFLVDGLVSRMESGDIVVPTFDPEFQSASGVEGFQRGFVWTKPQADKFLESLLLGMPVPGIFLVREPDGVLLVLDGHQRMRTLHSFNRGVFRDKEYRLEYVQPQWEGLRYEDLEDEDRRRLDDSIIHATILRQDDPNDDYSAIYSIFERINTGGTPLQPQEIRVALFGGPFVSLLRELNGNTDWRTLYGRRSPRLKDQELVLRFFAMFEDAQRYRRPVKGFLNSYLQRKRQMGRKDVTELVETFEATVSALNTGIGKSAFRPVRSLNAAVMDSIMVGVANRIADRGPILRPDLLKSRYEKLLASTEYLGATSSSTAAEESVETRLRLATQAFRTAK